MHYKRVKQPGEDEECIFSGSDDGSDVEPSVRVQKKRGRSRRRLVAGAILVLLAAVAIPVLWVLLSRHSSCAKPPRGWSNVIQSPSDHRQYLATQLDNGLRVLLIHDNKTDYAAASMDVAVGSYYNPDDVLGLAHFCEHMLFMGTKKFPRESEFSQFVSENGGYDNAYTSSENTNYYFKVNFNQLRPTLDRFLQFFVSPLFLSNATSREMHAVDSEYRKDIPQDPWRFWELLKTTASQKHPLSRFDVGSLQTLQIPDIRQRLLQFHHDHYTVNRVRVFTTNYRHLWSFCSRFNFHQLWKINGASIVLIPKLLEIEKRLCVRWLGVINLTWENLQIAKHKSVR